MGRLILPDEARISVDANAVIYHVEKLEPFRSKSASVWDGPEQGRCRIETSELTLLEVLVKPIRDHDHVPMAGYRDLLSAGREIIVHPVDRAVLEQAAEVRADYRLRTPDAIHAATAIRVGSPLFLTNDASFRKVAGLKVAILDEIVAA